MLKALTVPSLILAVYRWPLLSMVTLCGVFPAGKFVCPEMLPVAGSMLNTVTPLVTPTNKWLDEGSTTADGAVGGTPFCAVTTVGVPPVAAPLAPRPNEYTTPLSSHAT